MPTAKSSTSGPDPHDVARDRAWSASGSSSKAADCPTSTKLTLTWDAKPLDRTTVTTSRDGTFQHAPAHPARRAGQARHRRGPAGLHGPDGRDRSPAPTATDANADGSIDPIASTSFTWSRSRPAAAPDPTPEPTPVQDPGAGGGPGRDASPDARPRHPRPDPRSDTGTHAGGDPGRDTRPDPGRHAGLRRPSPHRSRLRSRRRSRRRSRPRSRPRPDPGRDSGPDAGADSGPDPVADAGPDADRHTRPDPVPTPVATPVPTPVATPVPTPVPPAPPAAGPMYGSALAMDSKNNYQVGWTVNQKVSHRFRAGTSSTLTSIAINQRGGSGYSGGNGGTMKVTIQTDNAGKPSGTVLASVSWAPGNPSAGWENRATYTFPSPASLTKGQMYHVVFTNTDPSPSTNYISVNEGYQFTATTPRQPGFSDDFAVMYDRGAGWVVLPERHPGHGSRVCQRLPRRQRVLRRRRRLLLDHLRLDPDGPRAVHRYSGTDRTVTSATVRVKRISGSSPLTVRLESSSGSVLGTGTTAASQIPTSTIPVPVNSNSWDEASLAGGRWVTVTFPAPVVLSAGATYNLRMSTASDTTYVAVPIREEDATTPVWGARAFRDGSAQETTDGSTWHQVYDWAPLDEQFYLR